MPPYQPLQEGRLRCSAPRLSLGIQSPEFGYQYYRLDIDSRITLLIINIFVFTGGSTTTVSISLRGSSAFSRSAPINPHHVQDTAVRVEEKEGRQVTENSDVGTDRGAENSDFLADRMPCMACSTRGQAAKDFYL